MKLRPYQKEAADAVLRAWEEKPSTLVVMPTGTGKTILMAEIVQRKQPARVMVLAHREELVFQARNKIGAFTGLECQVAFDYEVLDAIEQGWLVPVEQQMVHGSGLDFSKCRTTAGDFNGADLADVMEANHERGSKSMNTLNTVEGPGSEDRLQVAKCGRGGGHTRLVFRAGGG